MDVHIDTKRAPPFSIEIWYFDTVLDIKKKIHKSRGIPIQRQNLFFNGQLLLDDRDTVHYHILQDSRIQLHVSPPSDVAPSSTAEIISSPQQPPILSPPPPPPPPPTNNNITIRIKTPKPNHHLSIEIDQNDTVSSLKEKIHEIEGIPVNRLILQSSNGGGGGGGSSELLDHRSLRDCDLADNSEITAGIRAVAVVPTATATKKLKLLVLTKCGTKKVPVEVNAGDNVGELRKELQRMQQRMQFPLPQEGYFFIYKQNVMDDDQSFRWHHVGNGDTIEIFNGSVTGGS
ncbi:Ubiquitin domain-containing protein 7SL RNA1 [Linum perenne]